MEDATNDSTMEVNNNELGEQSDSPTTSKGNKKQKVGSASQAKTTGQLPWVEKYRPKRLVPVC